MKINDGDDDDDDDDYDELCYSFLDIMSGSPLSSASSVVLLKLSALIMAPPGQTVFLTCVIVCPSILSVRLLPNLSRRYFEND